MNFIIALAEVLIFLLCLHKVIKKNPIPFYILALFLSALIILRSALGLGKEWPELITKFFVSPLYRGGISCALFVIVMWLGVLPKSNKIIRSLYVIRGEISIMACIFALAHNISYGFLGKKWFIQVFTNPSEMGHRELSAAIVSILLMIIMIPLFITSFQNIRKKMSPLKWKKLQKWAYLFYILLYVHVLLLFIPKALGDDHKRIASAIQNLVVYSIAFVPYFFLLAKKLLSQKKNHTTMENMAPAISL